MNTPVSTINTIITKSYLQNQPENQYFERKGLGDKDIKASKIAEELIGMLNADGGVLVFGVSDKGEIQDLNLISDKLNSYRTLIFEFITPPCHIQLEEIFIDGKLIFLFHVEQDLERIFSRKDNEEVFLRVADSNRKLNREQIKKLEYDKNIRLFEDEVVEDFDPLDLDQDLLNSYKQKLNFKSDDILSLLYKRNLIAKQGDEYKFKKSAILLFSQDPERYIPSASVRYVRYEGITAKTGVEHNVVKDQRFENNIPRLIEELSYFLRASLRDYYFLDIQQGKFKKVPEYPEEAWLEGIVNALCHRSYNVQGNVIYIKQFDDRLEISNSGPLPAQVTVENIKTERFARNPRIARVLEDLGYVRQLNEGVSRIYESMEKSLLAKPEYREQNGNVYLTLRNRVSSHEKTISADLMLYIEDNWLDFNDTQKAILNYLFINGSATITDLTEHIQINKNSVRSYINGFMDKGIIERHSDKQRDLNAKYSLKKD
ncbi:ATPase [Canicola haemoglobinophilus]|uniref:Transcriptional regulator containing an hth domain n=1 Tax=Canicola haemoglobinophilus TaxID=733 RepID=A0A1V4B2D8_9PAST|nr:ATP-binding protein [Canicola haemoglobinophilus]OOS01430.1 ATPase [Canicola haemoglobinophilus]STO54658.1 transcriptional regulator containing an hth domain [Canicola haemoglobinophilus]STO59877.1 transcriptional regulator containing an hth domain [Canicola haemoglobinophilus]STO67567.1 transcriptional regulator containing an hth domain [Canicola haemoglobinophilus]